MNHLVRTSLIVSVGAFICASGVMFTLWLYGNHGLCLAMLLPVAVGLTGVVIMVMGVKLQGKEIFIEDLLKGRLRVH
jgi:hypothetical protein